jgi:hypothetical protein
MYLVGESAKEGETSQAQASGLVPSLSESAAISQGLPIAFRGVGRDNACP